MGEAKRRKAWIAAGGQDWARPHAYLGWSPRREVDLEALAAFEARGACPPEPSLPDVDAARPVRHAAREPQRAASSAIRARRRRNRAANGHVSIRSTSGNVACSRSHVSAPSSTR